MSWPPTLPILKDDVDIPAEDTEDDAKLQRRLDAAVSFVQRVRRDAFETGDDGTIVEPVVYSAQGEREAEALEQGTLMLAARLFARRRSPDVIFWMAETGTTQAPFNDRDIDRLLRIGLHELPKVG